MGALDSFLDRAIAQPSFSARLTMPDRHSLA
jgi:hypothetical protein